MQPQGPFQRPPPFTPNAAPPPPSPLIIRLLLPNEPITPAYINHLLQPNVLDSIPGYWINRYISPAVVACLSPQQKSHLSRTWAQIAVNRNELERRRQQESRKFPSQPLLPNSRPHAPTQLPSPPQDDDAASPNEGPALANDPTFRAFANMMDTYSVEELRHAWIAGGSRQMVALTILLNGETTAFKPSINSRAIALIHQSNHKLIVRPPSLAAAIAKAADLFALAPESITLKALVGSAWFDVLEESWNLAALTKSDPTTLRVFVVPSGSGRGEKRMLELEDEDEKPSKRAATDSLKNRGKGDTIDVEGPTLRFINITVTSRAQDPDVYIKCKPTTATDKIFYAVAQRLEIEPDSFELVYGKPHRLCWRPVQAIGDVLAAWGAVGVEDLLLEVSAIKERVIGCQ